MKDFFTRSLCILAVLAALPLTALAQEGTITGTITDGETETTIPGVNVVVTGTNLGAATGIDGRYEIEGVPAGAQTVRVSFTGYEDDESDVVVSAGETATVDFALQPSVAELEQVVVEGYRVQPRGAEVTGSSVQVSGEVIAEANVQNASAALQGRAAGVRVTSSSGEPGAAFSVDVRGQSSINAGTDPLYIVDGVQIGTQDISNESNLSPLTGIDPGDIESIRVLKDASATAIYGARAANGVVLITTRQGQAGETQVNFSAELGAVGPLSDFDILSAQQWVDYTTLQAENRGIPDPEQAIRSALSVPDTLTNPDWYDAVHRTGLTQGYDLSVSGGNETTRFRISGTYERDKGQVIESYLNQAGLRVNLAHDVSDDVTVEARVNLTNLQKRGSISDGAFINSPFWASYLIRPYIPIYTDPGNSDSDYNLEIVGGGSFNQNVVAQEDFNTTSTDGNQIQASTSGTIRFFPWLYARTLVGLIHTDLSEKDRRDPRLPSNASIGGSAFVSSTRELEFNVSQTLNYNFSPGDRHDLSGLVGAEYRRSYRQFTGAGGQGFPFFLFQNLANTATPTSATESDTEARFLGFFGEAEYTYDDRYTGRVTLRYDGSSRFGADTRYGLFGSAGASWSIADEAFMEDVGFVEELNLRASYGVLGNSDFQQTFGNFAARQTFGGGGEYVGQAGITPGSLGNPDLTWEEASEIDLGLDYSLFGARVSGAFDVYRKDTDQLLLPRDLASTSGYGSVLSNIGEIRSEGIEVDLSTINLDVGDFRWDTNFNIAFERSEVLELYEGADGEPLDEIRTAGLPGGTLYRVDEPLAQWEFVEWAGVNPANGRPLYRDGDGNLTYTVPTSLDAQKTYGNVLPDFLGGFGNTFSYAGLTLTALFQFDYGRTTFNNDRYFIDGDFNFNHTTDVLEDFWKEPGDVSARPQPYYGTRPGGSPYGDGYFLSSVFVEDASYIRLKQVRLSYALPTSLLQPTGIRGATIFANATNLLTLTDYTGVDPEVVGVAIGQYPQNRRFTGGVRLSF